MNIKQIRELFKSVGIAQAYQLKSNASIYGKGAPSNVFTYWYKDRRDSSWYCMINEDETITINEKYFTIPVSVIKYNDKITGRYPYATIFQPDNGVAHCCINYNRYHSLSGAMLISELKAKAKGMPIFDITNTTKILGLDATNIEKNNGTKIN